MTAPRPRPILLDVFPILLLLILPCLLLWRVAFLGESLLPADLLRDIAPWRQPTTPAPVPWTPLQWDGIAEFYPWRLFAATTLKHGFLPLWNPHQFCGTPFVANSQSAVLYPLNLLFVLLPVPTAFGVSALLHLMLTGLLMYGFLRSPAIAFGRSAGTLGAVAWQMSAWLAAWLALPTFLCVSAWLPLALWLTDRLTARPGMPRAATLGVCLGVMLLGGHLQIAFYCLLLVIGYGIFRVVPLRHLDRRFALRFVGYGALALALMAGIAAPQLLPTVELSHVSHRAGGMPNWKGYQSYVSLALPAANLVTLWLPKFFGSPTQGNFWGIGTNGGGGAYMENACYIGLLSLLLGIIALAMTWRSQTTTRFFAITALIALLLALGTPLNTILFFGIPGFAQSGSPGRILVLWTFCGAFLAASGLQGLQKRFEEAGRALLWSLGAFVLLLVSAGICTAVWVGRNAPAGTLAANLRTETDLWRLPAGILLGAAALYALRKRGTLSPRGFGVLLTALAALDLLAVNLGFNLTAKPAAVYPTTPGITFLQQHREEGRVMPLNRAWSLTQPPTAVLPPNSAMVYGLMDTQGYDSLLTRQYIDWSAKLDGGSPAPPENGNMVFTNAPASLLSEEAGVRYVVSRGLLTAPDPKLRLAMQDGETYIYQDSAALPRVRTGDGKAVGQVEDLAPTWLRLTPDAGVGSIVVADQWYPGWHATTEGEEVPIREAPDIFRTVNLDAQKTQAKRGQATLEMRYLPMSFRLGLYGLCLAITLVSATVAATASSCGWLGRSGR